VDMLLYYYQAMLLLHLYQAMLLHFFSVFMFVFVNIGF